MLIFKFIFANAVSDNCLVACSVLYAINFAIFDMNDNFVPQFIAICVGSGARWINMISALLSVLIMMQRYIFLIKSKYYVKNLRVCVTIIALISFLLTLPVFLTDCLRKNKTKPIFLDMDVTRWGPVGAQAPSKLFTKSF